VALARGDLRVGLIVAVAEVVVVAERATVTLPRVVEMIALGALATWKFVETDLRAGWMTTRVVVVAWMLVVTFLRVGAMMALT
jgi:hypothetical protein